MLRVEQGAARQTREKLEESASVLRGLAALPRRVVIRHYQILLNSWLTVLRTIDRHNAAVSLREDGDELLLNLRRQREAVLQKIDEIKQAIVQLQKDEEPEL